MNVHQDGCQSWPPIVWFVLVDSDPVYWARVVDDIAKSFVT